MKSSEGKIGRVFVLRLEDGDRIPDSIEAFAAGQGVARGVLTLVGGVEGGALTVGPADSKAETISPMRQGIDDAHEIAAVGTLFPDAEGRPKLHMHGALGRGDKALAGCLRAGLGVWRIGEVVLLEILDTPMTRRVDPAFGFEILSEK